MHPTVLLIRSNRLEILADLLAADVGEPVPALAGSAAAVVTPEPIVVQSRGMERWVAMELARRLGVWANPRFVFPRALIEEVLENALGGEREGRRRWAREGLVWAIARALPPLLDDPRFAPLARYLDQPDPAGRRPLQLAGRIAHLFDQYVVYRPDLVLAWEQGADHGAPGDDVWQPALWRALHSALGDGHLAHRVRDLQARVESGAGPLPNLPPRLSLFGVTTLPPLYLSVLLSLAPTVQVRVYHHAPSDAWFADDRPKAEIARLLRDVTVRPEDVHLEQGHPLLASMGRVARDFQFYLADLDAQGHVAIEERDLFVDPGELHLLRRLQHDVRFRIQRGQDAPPVPLAADDQSIQVHSCHGPMREVEVLRDRLLGLLQADETLRPRDMVVMMPDVEAYAPFVDAVFGLPPRDPGYLPYRLADRNPRAENQVVEAFLAVLSVARGRLTAPDVLDLVALAPVSARLGLSADDVAILRVQVDEAGVRWAADAAHRAQVGQPEDAGNTWRFGLDRLVLGCAMGDESMWAGALPVGGIEGALAATVGRFAAGCEALFALRTELSSPRLPQEWAPLLVEALKRFVDVDEATAWQHQAVREALDDLSERASRAGFDEPVTLDVIQDQLELAFAEPGAAHGFLSGGVTFCALLPMRSIPFRVVCLLGMNDDAFPRQSRSLGFNLLEKAPRRGDRSPREDDRYLFLEAVLSARDHLVLTYSGQGIQDNKARPPSTCVSELLDVLGASCALGEPPADDPEEACARVRERLVLRHPLQPFSARYFVESDPEGTDGPGLYSFAWHWCAGAGSLLGPRAVPPTLLSEPLPAPADEALASVDLDVLVRFFRDPARALLRGRIGVSLDHDALVLEDREPLALESLDRWAAGERLLEQALSGADPAESWATLRALGVLPLGTPGRVGFDDLLPLIDALAAPARPWREGEARPPLSVDVACGPTRLVGAVEHLWPETRLRASFSRLGAGRVLDAWIRHLALLCAAPDEAGPPPKQTVVVGRSPSGAGAAVVTFGEVEEPGAKLDALVALWRAGQAEPLPFLPDAALAYAAAVAEGKDGMGEARKSIASSQRSGFGDWSADVARVWEGGDPLSEDGDFAALAAQVMGPLLAHGEWS
jgi:exodeoxyribonuclease V gamma subunit